MNPKISLFLSATLTAFVVAILSGVVNKVTSTSAAEALAPTSTVALPSATATLVEPTDLPSPTAQTVLGPLDAVTLASQAINRKDVYSVESSTYKGVDAFKVVFTSGDVVYIGLDSTVLSKTKLQAVVANLPAAKPTKVPHHGGGSSTTRGNNHSSGGSTSASAPESGGEQESGGGGDD